MVFGGVVVLGCFGGWVLLGGVPDFGVLFWMWPVVVL